ncbi:hypothetical protein BDZ97DRAFT_1831250 [Flammula alnicola]|nr:hypothetical protein BDZ97DRAFT_1831250 [Flammula alnicola]
MFSQTVSVLSTNNHSPSKEELIEIRSLRTEPIKELAEVDSLILEAQKTLDSLTERRNALQSSIELYDTILSPFRRVPHDVWREIFPYCLSTDRNPIMSYSEAPLLLTHVCSVWRSIAFTTPQIWTNIHIPIFQIFRDPIWEVPSYHLDNPEIHEIPHKAQMRAEQVREWLDRSGSLALSVSVSNPSGESASGDLHSTLLDNIVRFSDRLENLDLMMMASNKLYDRFIKLPSSQLSNLRALKVYAVPPRIDQGNTTQWYDSSLFAAPSLRKLSIGYLPAPGPSPELFPLPTSWRQLSSLTVNNSIPLKWARIFLVHCHNLVDCYFKINDNHNPGIVQDINDNYYQISLPHMVTMSISDDCLNSSSFYNAMQLPVLRTLACYDATATLRPTIETPHFLHLLSRLETLEKLVINPRVLSKNAALECFHLTSSITHLCLGRNHDYGSPLLPTRTSISDVIEMLSALYPSKDDPTESIMLLPKLETLEAYGVIMSDKKFLDFIVARLNPTIPGVTRLKKATVRFHRMKQMDISRQVEYHARAVGVDFKLDLTYMQKNIQKGLSPSFGLPIYTAGSSYRGILKYTLSDS